MESGSYRYHDRRSISAGNRPERDRVETQGRVTLTCVGYNGCEHLSAQQIAAFGGSRQTAFSGGNWRRILPRGSGINALCGDRSGMSR
jgi:hypothetical protein